MNVHFETINKGIAAKYLKHKKYNFLSDAHKKVILDNVGPDCKVQDPSMYAKPIVRIFSQAIANVFNEA